MNSPALMFFYADPENNTHKRPDCFSLLPLLPPSIETIASNCSTVDSYLQSCGLLVLCIPRSDASGRGAVIFFPVLFSDSGPSKQNSQDLVFIQLISALLCPSCFRLFVEPSSREEKAMTRRAQQSSDVTELWSRSSEVSQLLVVRPARLVHLDIRPHLLRSPPSFSDDQIHRTLNLLSSRFYLPSPCANGLYYIKPWSWMFERSQPTGRTISNIRPIYVIHRRT